MRSRGARELQEKLMGAAMAMTLVVLLRRSLRLALALLSVAVLSACKVELYNNIDQRQANEITAALLRSGIPAERVVGKGGRFMVAVEERHFAEAVRILNDNGLSKQEFATLGDVFKKEGLVSSPVQERAQMIYALSQELARTVSDMDGVLSARVHLVLPENDPLRQQLIPSSASVFVRHHASVPMGDLVPQIKMLVANGIAGLSYDKVSVILLPVETHARIDGTAAPLDSVLGVWVHPESRSLALWLFYGLIGLVLVLACALGFVVWRQRQTVYPLRSVTSVKAS